MHKLIPPMAHSPKEPFSGTPEIVEVQTVTQTEQNRGREPTISFFFFDIKLNIASKNNVRLLIFRVFYQLSNRFPARHVFIFIISAVLVLNIGMPAYAAEEGLASSSPLIVRENYQTEEPMYVNVGEVVNINGTITKTTNILLDVDLTLRSNSSLAGGDLLLLDQQPGSSFVLSEPVTEFQFEVQFLKEGSYYVRPWATIAGSPNATLPSGPIDADSLSCDQCAGLGTTVVVSGMGVQNGNNNNGLSSVVSIIPPYVAVAIAAGGVAVVVLYMLRRGESRKQS